uniref:Uncharacterized protein n=1 Tax=Arcella intermedia TaxID=1963864 RepID=A0A6B2LAH9_9EUKA
MVVLVYMLSSTIGYSLLYRFVLPSADWSAFQGEWAFVSGSSYGIGAQFAESLAKRGLNIILCARTEHKLLEIEKNIKNLYPHIQTKILLADVLQDGWESVLDEVSHLNVSVIVNNVGGGNLDGTLKYYHEFSEEHHANILKLNLFSVQKVLSKFLPKLIQRHKGRIINISSMAYLLGYKMSLYGPSKGFVNTWTEQLNTEYEDFGIQAEVLMLGEVSTPAIGNKPADGFMVARPSQVTEKALDMFGYQIVYAPFWGHAFVHWACSTLLPHSVLRFSIRLIFASKIGEDLRMGHQVIQKIRQGEGKEKEQL